MALTAMAIGSIAAPAIGGIVGNIMSRGDRDAAAGIMKDIYAKYSALQIPDIEKQKLALAEFKQAAPLSMQTEVAQQLGGQDAFQDITVDPRLRQAQMDQLQSMSKLGDTGFTPGEQAKLNQMQRSVESDNQSRLRAMLQGQDVRGVGSSDAALAARMISGQSAANRQAEQSDNMAAMAFDRALQAKQAAGQLGGQMENLQYGQSANLAKALNERELQNMLQKSGVGARNVASFNEAQKYNKATEQDILNQNVNLSNQQQQYNKQLLQQQYQNQLQKLAGMSGAGSGAANQLNASADATAGMWSNIGAGAGKAMGGMNLAANKATPASAATQAKAQSTINDINKLPELKMKG